ncbi:MAG: MBL fold metallo-hydrolase [Holophaga sp.]|nr:MBL fold metallo-hydrolase [Holophaga sp.]
MTRFEVIALGVGDTFSEHHHPTSLLLVADGCKLAIDCPDMYRRVLRDASLKGAGPLALTDIDDVLLTHVHGDHMNGLEGVGYLKYFADHKRLRLHTLPEVLEVLWERRLHVSMGRLWDGEAFKDMRFEDYFDARPLAWEGVNRIGPFEVEIRRTRHHVPTCALRVRFGGRILGYSCDTAFDLDLIEWLSGADLIVHETNLGPAHTLASDLAGLPESLRKKMCLIHYPDSLDLQTVPIRALLEGDVLKV